MPIITRREPAGLNRAGPPALVLTFVGPWDAVVHALQYGGMGPPHILGPDGPRGGARTLCGLSYRRDRWHEFREQQPALGYTSQRRWQNLCSFCKEALGAPGG